MALLDGDLWLLCYEDLNNHRSPLFRQTAPQNVRVLQQANKVRSCLRHFVDDHLDLSKKLAELNGCIL